MSSEIIVVLILVALAIVGIVYLELHSRRNKKEEKQSSQLNDNE
jgi:flagellar basal body-associated protein FliL